MERILEYLEELYIEDKKKKNLLANKDIYSYAMKQNLNIQKLIRSFTNPKLKLLPFKYELPSDKKYVIHFSNNEEFLNLLDIFELEGFSFGINNGSVKEARNVNYTSLSYCFTIDTRKLKCMKTYFSIGKECDCLLYEYNDIVFCNE